MSKLLVELETSKELLKSLRSGLMHVHNINKCMSSPVSDASMVNHSQTFKKNPNGNRT